MSFDAATLKALIDDHGKSLTYASKGSPTYDTSTGTVTSSDTSYTVTGYFYNYNLGDFNGDSVVLGDRRVVIPTVDTSNSSITSPKSGDTFSGQGDKVTVVGVQTILSGDNTMCYICQVRE